MQLIELPRAEKMQAFLQGLLADFRSVGWDDEVTSTNTLLLERLRSQESLQCPMLLGANAQTQGRGRLGRRWQDVKHRTLMFSCALATECEVGRIAALAPLMGMAAAELLREQIPVTSFSRLTLKWPNDIMFDGAKLSGLLVETAGSAADGRQQLVIGMGLNLSHSKKLSDSLRRPIADWGSIMSNSHLKEQSVEAYLAGLVTAIARAWQQTITDYEQHGFEYFHARFEHVNGLIDKDVTVFNGDQILLSGCVKGVDNTARLLVQTADGEVAVSSGEVSVRAKNDPSIPAKP